MGGACHPRPAARRKHRRSRARSILELSALLVAIIGVVLLLTLPGGPKGRDQSTATTVRLPSLAEIWPGVSPVSQLATLADSTPYTPQLYLTASTSVGTAPTRDGTAVRVLLRDTSGARELRRVEADQYPQFAGFTASGDDLFWAESTSPGNEAVRTRLYRANWKTGSRPVLITADTGEVVVTESQSDLVISGGRLRWVSAESGPTAVTGVRSVPLGGGTVTVKRVDGAFALSTWPWLVSFGTSVLNQLELVNVDTGQRVKLTTTPAEVARCGPTWCRIVVLAGDAIPVRIDLQRPDGSQRRRIAGADANAVVADVALLDRFEPLGLAGAADDLGRQLVLYDIAKDRTVAVATEVDMIRARHGVLWWSTGTETELVWHSLDLRDLK